MITLDKVNKSYGQQRVVRALSLSIERGELVVLIGASGSGKSTLLKMINRLEPHDSGRIVFDGQDIDSLNPRALRLRMGYAIQSVGLFPHWTVARNIATVPTLMGWPKARIAERVAALLTMLNLDPALYGPRYPHQLSGGQQQRVGVARALAGDPDVLLMDEPFGALDPVTRASLQQELKRIHQMSGKTIVLVTHDIDEALLLATRVVLIDHGQVVQVGTPLQLLSQPANDFVSDFVGRSDLGIKLLSLQPVLAFLRDEPPVAHAVLASNATLREAVSTLVQQRTQSLNVQDPSGQHLGVLHATDVFAAARAPHA